MQWLQLHRGTSVFENATRRAVRAPDVFVRLESLEGGQGPGKGGGFLVAAHLRHFRFSMLSLFGPT